MNIGFSQRVTRKTQHENLTVTKGCAIADPVTGRGRSAEAHEHLAAQNQELSKERMVELTYGPKKPKLPNFEPQYVKVDEKKILTFDGVIRDQIQDWETEKHRIHFVKVFYYLEDDTIKVFEPRIRNSGLFQGTLLKRGKYLLPNNVRDYNWKDFNIGVDLHLFGRTIHIYDCDLWTREYLTFAGIEVSDPEPKPEDPTLREMGAMQGRKEYKDTPMDDVYPSGQFFSNAGKVLRFYGIFKNTAENPTGMRRIVINYYLEDGTLEVIENWKPNSGYGPIYPTNRKVLEPLPFNIGLGCWMTIVKRQKIIVDREKEVEKIPCYLAPGPEDHVQWMTPKHLKTGEDINILGKIFFLNKCNEFTQQFYKDHYAIDVPQMELIEKPKLIKGMLISTHVYGKWEEGAQDCYTPHAKLRDKVNVVPPKPKEVAETVLRFAAIILTPRETELDRTFVISYFMEDDTVKIFEERKRNSGHVAGPFLERCRLRKDLGKIAELTPSLALGAKPEYYEPSDFYIGARIRAGGNLFLIKDADFVVFKFMENHPEIYPDVDAKEQMELADYLKGFIKPTHEERMRLLQELKREVLSYNGSPVYPYPKTLNLGTYYRPRYLVDEELYSANLPISRVTLKKLVDAYTFKGKTDVEELKPLLMVALGHDCYH